MIDLPPISKLWTPQKPAIVRAASLDEALRAMPLMGTFAAASIRGLRPSRVVDPNTVCLLHFDGTNGATATTDDAKGGAAPHPVTFVGSAIIATAQKKFGASSLSCPGSSCVSIADSADFKPSGSFTIDFWVYYNNFTGEQAPLAKIAASNFSPYFIYSNGSGALGFYSSSNGSSWDISNGTAIGTVSATTWAHIAIVRNGNTWYTFKDGVQGATFSSSSLPMQTTDAVYLGGNNRGGGAISYYMNGYVDDFRFSKVARWTAGFTPPSAPHTA